MIYALLFFLGGSFVSVATGLQFLKISDLGWGQGFGGQDIYWLLMYLSDFAFQLLSRW
jgi:hypothetical protein